MSKETDIKKNKKYRDNLKKAINVILEELDVQRKKNEDCGVFTIYGSVDNEVIDAYNRLYKFANPKGVKESIGNRAKTQLVKSNCAICYINADGIVESEDNVDCKYCGEVDTDKCPKHPLFFEGRS